MNLVDLYEKLNGKIEGFTPAIVVLEHIETGDRVDKFVMVRDGKLEQVFGVTQTVLDVIDLTDDELIHYITEWTKACGSSLSEWDYQTSSTSMRNKK